MKKLLFFCVMLFGVMQVSYAQRAPMDEVVYLKNGSIVRGVIVEQVPNKSLKIETADGSLFVFGIDEVEKITKEPKVRNGREAYQQTAIEDSNNKTGRRMGMVQFFGLGFQDSYVSSYDEGAAFFNCNFIYGYQFKNRFFVGGGVGMEFLGGVEHLADDRYYGYSNNYLRIPVFATAKINLNKKRISPFFQIDLGYYFNTDGYAEDGAFFHPKFGVDFNLGSSRRKALFLSLSLFEYGMRTEEGYNYYYNGYSYGGGYGNSYESSYDYYRYNEYDIYAKIGLNFGLRF